MDLAVLPVPIFSLLWFKLLTWFYSALRFSLITWFFFLCLLIYHCFLFQKKILCNYPASSCSSSPYPSRIYWTSCQFVFLNLLFWMLCKSAFHRLCFPAPSNIILIIAINSLFYVFHPWLFFYLVQILSLSVLSAWNIWSYTHLLFFGSCDCNLIVSFVSSSSEFLLPGMSQSYLW